MEMGWLLKGPHEHQRYEEVETQWELRELNRTDVWSTAEKLWQTQTDGRAPTAAWVPVSLRLDVLLLVGSPWASLHPHKHSSPLWCKPPWSILPGIQKRRNVVTVYFAFLISVLEERCFFSKMWRDTYKPNFVSQSIIAISLNRVEKYCTYVIWNEKLWWELTSF